MKSKNPYEYRATPNLHAAWDEGYRAGLRETNHARALGSLKAGVKEKPSRLKLRALAKARKALAARRANDAHK